MKETDIYKYAFDRLAAGADPERVIQELADAHIPDSRVRNIVGSASGDLIRRDHYEVLGVSRAASAREIKTAYRKKALQYHPDRNINPGAAERFRQINNIYQTLVNPQTRAQYDRSLHSVSDNYRAKQPATKETPTRERHGEGRPHFNSDHTGESAQESPLYSGWEHLFFRFIARGHNFKSIHVSRRPNMLRAMLQTKTIARRIALLCLLSREVIIKRFNDQVSNQSVSEELTNNILDLLRRDRDLCKSACMGFLSLGGRPTDLTRGLVVELGLSQSEAANVVYDALSTVQKDADKRMRFVVVAIASIIIATAIVYVAFFAV